MVLKIEDLHVEIAGKEILRGIDLEIGTGQTTVLFGPNGSGKSTLLAAVMGLGHCKVTKGRITFFDIDITNMPIDERARLGIGMMMQRPPNIVGVKLKDLVTIISGDSKTAMDMSNEFKMDKFLERDVNVGFSGGEIKRSELLQLASQCPQFILLDEPESGVDLENIDLVGNKVRGLLYGNACNKREDGVSALVITHTGQILDYIGADRAYVLKDGMIACSGRPTDLLKDIRMKGYGECVKCRMIKM
ncbi:MAG: ABC transporter ATP-binding protein [Methanomassiliicoccaceae archaeon]|nr:ABC transporter ATP-binding protein [Methanomassiliicoccaceae archaeon]